MSFNVPDPEERIDVALWKKVRSWMLDNDPDAAPMMKWAQEEVGMPTDAQSMAGEIIWIILCAGKTAQAARTIESKVWKAIHAGEPVLSAFGHKSRAAAIEYAWNDRDRLYAELIDINQDMDRLMAWCMALPWVGQITTFQLMKNFGVDCAKPDIWLCRLAGIADKPAGKSAERFSACMALCRPLAESTNDRIATVDSLLWLACNKGILKVNAMGGPISMVRKTITARQVIAALPTPKQIDMF